MKDKFCVSKSLAYLVALVVVVVGAYFVMNYANTTQKTANTQAAAECRQNGVKGYKLYKKNYANCAAFQARMNVTMTAYPAANDKDSIGEFICCIPGKALGAGAGIDTSKTCKKKGGDWFRDTTAAALSARLTTKWAKATATAVPSPSDAASYPGRYCYSVAYKYTNEDASGNTLQTCRQAGGTDWYSYTAAQLQSAYVGSSGNTVTVTEKSGPFADSLYYPGKHCLVVGPVTYATPTP